MAERLALQNAAVADHAITAERAWVQSPESARAVRDGIVGGNSGTWTARGRGPQRHVLEDLASLRERLSGLAQGPEGMRVDNDRAYELMWRKKPHRFLVRVRGNGRYEWSHWNGDTEKLVVRKNVRVAGRDRGLLKRLRRYVG